MNITVRFEAQVRRAAGATSTSLDVDNGATVSELLQKLADGSTEPVRHILLDDRGRVRSTVLIFLNDEHHPLTSDRRLTATDSVTISSPISGG
jgi:molybdopterin converting factor small subunit